MKKGFRFYWAQDPWASIEKIRQLNGLFKSVGWHGREEEVWDEIYRKSNILEVWSGDRLVGFGRIVEDGVMCMFYDIAVRPAYQKQGVGRLVMERLINEVKDRNFASIGLFCWAGNPILPKFYKKFGFKTSRKAPGMQLFKHMTGE